jgi:hypothetical protein
MKQKKLKKQPKISKKWTPLHVAKKKGNKKKLHIEAKEQGTKDRQNNYTHDTSSYVHFSHFQTLNSFNLI